MVEEWRPVCGYEDSYAVSSRGRVKSLPKIDALGHRLQEKVLSLYTNKRGHTQVKLWRDGWYITRTVRHLMVRAGFDPEVAKEPE